MPVAAYLAYTRPRSIPVTLVMVVTGWLASPAHPHDACGIAADLAFFIGAFSILLWGGTNAFNSAEDRDDGPVNLLPDPPPLPPHLGAFGLALMAAAIAASALRGGRCALLAAAAVALSIFYSWRGGPSRRGKELPGLDNAINASGCGLGSFLYGWCATGATITAFALVAALAWTVLLFGGMPTAQIFQLPVERAPNWTSLLGPRRTLRVGAVLFAVHLIVLAAVSPLRVTTIVWAVGIVAGVCHSAWWSRTPLVDPYRRMLRQMTLLTAAQLAWAIGFA